MPPVFFSASSMHARLCGDIEKDTDGLTGSELFEFRLCCFISDRARNRIAFGKHRLGQGPSKSAADAGDEPVGHRVAPCFKISEW